MNYEQKVDGPKVNGQRERFVTTEEKAQYELFRTGKLPRETIERWVRNDLEAVLSFVHGMLRDEVIFKAVVDGYFDRYQKLKDVVKEE